MTHRAIIFKNFMAIVVERAMLGYPLPSQKKAEEFRDLFLLCLHVGLIFECMIGDTYLHLYLEITPFVTVTH